MTTYLFHQKRHLIGLVMPMEYRSTPTLLIPSKTTLALLLERLLIQSSPLRACLQRICIGSKPPSSSAFGVLPATWLYKTDGTLVTPLSDGIFDFIIRHDETYDSTGIAWITLMWSGTRWVYLGSNTWL